jgi:hypothetical protein
MNNPSTKKLIFTVTLLMLAFLTFAQSGLKTDKVIIFTDGNSYIQKSGTIETENSLFELKGEELPAARFGTLEISDIDNTILNTTSSIKPKELETKPLNISNAQDLLYQNKGIKLEILTDFKIISGELLEVFSDYIVVKADKIIMIKTSDIRSFSFDSEPALYKTPIQKESKVQLGMPGNDYNKDATLTIHFSSEGTKKLNLKYLQKGLSWSPMYTLRLLNEKKAELLLQAEIINDAEELINTDIDLVLGTPNFKFDMYLTDLLDYNNILDPFYETKNPRNSRRDYLAEFALPFINRDETVNEPQQEEDKQQHDFYIHRLQNISLKKNSRGLFRILNMEVTYRHIYECDLVELDYQNNNYNRKNIGPKNIVYHSILIGNNTDVLFGQGSMLVIDDTEGKEFPMAQNVLGYIPPKSEGIIKLTENPEIEIAHKEQIMNRSTNKVDFWGHNYYSATIEGSVTVKNLKSKGIELVIRNLINGELIDAGMNGEIVSQKQPVYSPNYLSKVKWTLHLKAGEEQEIKYQYKVLVQ